MKKSKAAFVAALVATTLFATAASANAWKMEPLIEQVPVIQQAQDLQETDRREFICLALTIYHEARGHGSEGKKAVGHVVLNRVNSGRFAPTICEVVWQHFRGRPQFSWTIRPVGAIVPRERAAWIACQEAALEVMREEDVDPTGGATHFYNARVVRPAWASNVISRWAYGAHVFVRPRRL